jgi:hypothetical protein
MKNRLMNNSVKEFYLRVSWVWQWMLMTFIGALTGWTMGGVISEVIFLMFVKKAPYDWASVIFEALSGSYQITPQSVALSVAAVTQIGQFIFAITFGLILLHGQQSFVDILRLKLSHRIVFFPLRGTVEPEEFNVFSDYLWAVLYCVIFGLFPFFVFVVLFFIGLNIFPNTIDFMWAVMTGFMAGTFGSRKAQDFVYQILYPHRLVQELQEAPKFWALLQQQAEEKRKQEELEKKSER